MRRAGGFVLLFTMGFVLLLTAAVLGFHARCSERTAAVRNAVDLIRTRAACEAGIALGARILQSDANSYDWLGEDWAGERSFSLGDVRITVGISDENARLNLNGILGEKGALNTGLLALFRNLVAVLGHPGAIADTMLDWIDEDEMPRVFGAEDTYYMSLTPPYHAPNQPLHTLRELALIKGFTPEVLEGSEKDGTSGLLDFVTVSSDSTINVNTCDRVLLNALGFSEMEVERIVAEREERPLDEGFLLRTNKNAYLGNRKLISFRSGSFSIACTARTAGGTTRRMRAHARRGKTVTISTIEDI